MSERVWNFSAGPGTLPLSVLKQAQEELLCLPGAGASVLEISHRSKAFDAVLEETQANLRGLLEIPDGYRILFLQGGASMQFSMIPMNFLQGGIADYIVTGSWGQKAVPEARREGLVNVAWDGKATNYDCVPNNSDLSLTPGARYLHFTSNETIQGVEFNFEPETTAPLVCDMSSNFLSRPVDVSKYALIYAGAQKNAGPAGATIVIIRDDLLKSVKENLHTMLDYRVQAENNSVYNTPPVFTIYMIMLVTRWLTTEIGGLQRMAEINQAKAQILYDAIGKSDGFYRGHAQLDCRSRMNVTWRLPSEELEAEFISAAKQEGLVELKGHRSVGGIRASIYNAMPMEGAVALRDFMEAFRNR
ncbi:MAG: 3-phosphoserine/phosphohydroxythreonine transaminase [Armatimonadetes bacterium]|nr:3-phosphoserine/phosphohydroxythreonine transaminase [Armatimonadota bacterium]